ncbi:MAG: TIGR04086 family membrane protein [Clostridia bacterium]|nr:TIGR04086 family membrane protein [Clostridia bacterium]
MHYETDQTGMSRAFEVAKASVVALLLSLIGAFIFAVILRFTSLSDKVILPVNQVIKTAAIFFGVLLCVRGEKGLLKGALAGLFATMLSYLAFSAIGGDFSLSWLAVLELLFGVFAGALSGIFAVNIKRN